MEGVKARTRKPSGGVSEVGTEEERTLDWWAGRAGHSKSEEVLRSALHIQEGSIIRCEAYVPGQSVERKSLTSGNR